MEIQDARCKVRVWIPNTLKLLQFSSLFMHNVPFDVSLGTAALQIGSVNLPGHPVTAGILGVSSVSSMITAALNRQYSV